MHFKSACGGCQGKGYLPKAPVQQQQVVMQQQPMQQTIVMQQPQVQIQQQPMQQQQVVGAGVVIGMGMPGFSMSMQAPGTAMSTKHRHPLTLNTVRNRVLNCDNCKISGHEWYQCTVSFLLPAIARALISRCL